MNANKYLLCFEYSPSYVNFSLYLKNSTTRKGAAKRLLSHFSHVRLCATPQMSAHQAPSSLGFSRQEHWSGLPFPPPMHESEKWKWSHSCPTLHDPMDCSLPGSSVHGIFQARVLEWVAIAFSSKKGYRITGQNASLHNGACKFYHLHLSKWKK